LVYDHNENNQVYAMTFGNLPYRGGSFFTAVKEQ